MPWKETSTMDQRIQFIADHLRGLYTKKALCRHYGISRPTGDKWIERYRIDGAEGLCERSRRPHWPPPHSFRVLIVTDLLSYAVPLEGVPYLAGHANPIPPGSRTGGGDM